MPRFSSFRNSAFAVPSLSEFRCDVIPMVLRSDSLFCEWQVKKNPLIITICLPSLQLSRALQSQLQQVEGVRHLVFVTKKLLKKQARSVTIREKVLNQ